MGVVLPGYAQIVLSQDLSFMIKCVYVCVCVCVCVRMCVHMYVHVCTYIHISFAILLLYPYTQSYNYGSLAFNVCTYTVDPVL